MAIPFQSEFKICRSRTFVRLTLAKFEDIVLEKVPGEDFRVVAEFVEVVK
jgi:hypothetical protein